MEKLKSSMSDQEWIKIYDMSNDKNLLPNLCQSLFPMIYGKLIKIFLILKIKSMFDLYFKGMMK